MAVMMYHRPIGRSMAVHTQVCNQKIAREPVRRNHQIEW